MVPSAYPIAMTAGLSLLLLAEHANAVHSGRRHHARLAAAHNKNNTRRDVSTILTGMGQGTLYYDLHAGGTCGPVNGWTSFPENAGITQCEPNVGYKTLAQRGSNRVVAMPSNMLSGNLAKYCGKEVIVTYGDNTVENLIIWDGCVACNDNDGLDFSSTVFAEVFGENNCDKGRIPGMSWKITNRQIWNLDGSPASGSSDSGNKDSDKPSATPSSTWTPEPEPTSSTSSTPLAAPKPSSSTKAWSASSKWVASSESSSSSSSSDKEIKPTATKLAPIADNTGSKWEMIAEASVSATSSSEAAEPSEDSESYSEDSSPEEDSTSTPVSSAEAVEETSDASIDEETAPAPTATTVAPIAAQGSSDGTVCNDVPGAWRCAGWSLQQCVQNPGDWTWSTRVKCNVAPINCDSPNPVCPDY